jgi:hypothetical protein
MKSWLVGVELFPVQGQPDKQTDMMRLVSHGLRDCFSNTPHNRIRQKQKSANCRFNAPCIKNGF